MPWPLIYAGAWLGALIGWIGVLAWDTYCNRDAEQRIDSYGQVDVPFVAEWDAEDNERIADREWAYDHGMLW